MMGTVSIPVSDRIGAKFASHGPDHICLIFFHKGVRVGSFFSERVGLTDFRGEMTDSNKEGVTLSEAIVLAEAEVDTMDKVKALSVRKI